jgi:acetyl-CoA carboxylase carboxyltransferase component
MSDLSDHNRLTSRFAAADLATPAHEKNQTEWLARVEKLQAERRQLLLGGGKTAIAKQHEKNRLTARERVDMVIDPGTPFHELLGFAAWEMYQEWGGAPGAGALTGVGRIAGKPVMIIANDATVKAGAFFPMTAKKVIRAQTIAHENHIPTLYLVDSAGVFLPLQDEVFPDIDDFGRVFYLNARMSAAGIPQIAAIMGSCVAGGGYLPVMCDTLLMTEGSGLYLAGPALVKAAIGQVVDSETLGGAKMHAQMSGTIDFREPDDERCLARVRSIFSRYGAGEKAPFSRMAEIAPVHDASELYKLFPLNPMQEYDVKEIILRIIDGPSGAEGNWAEYKAEYGRTIICGFARIGGWSVGIVANQKTHQKEKNRRFEVGGVIYEEAADKAARFIMNCSQNKIPLLFIHDVNGFMVGRESEEAGIIRSGAKMVNAVANATVPKISLITGGSFGAGHYAMCGRAYSPRFVFAWPSARYAVMSGDAAAKTLLDIRLGQLKKEGKQLSADEQAALLADIQARYAATLDPRYAAARLWIDEIILPHETRERLIGALDACACNPHLEEFKTGVLQV